jgi:cytochrome c-type biogenesis protein CcsB
MRSLGFIFSLLFSLQLFAQGIDGIPVQDAGRIKPYDTFAREALQLTWGREKYKGRPATHVVMSWFLIPDQWETIQFIQIRHSGLREALKLDAKRIYYAPQELRFNERVGLLFQDLRNKRDAREKLDPFFQALQTLENQITMFEAVRVGFAFRWVPAKEGDTWQPVSQLAEPYAEAFKKITKAFADYAGAEGRGDKGATKEAKSNLDKVSDEFVDLVKKEYGEDYGHFPQVKAELHYNRFHPFMWSWISYLLATILFGVYIFRSSKNLLIVSWLALIAGFILHTYGFGLRVFISGRAPVTNMYETVVWVAWGSVLIAVILNKFVRNKLLIPGSTAVATLCLILCDLSSHVLDETISPLEPVLRDNFWLVVHVLTITLSYAAFFLAFMIGDLVLFLALKNEEKFKDTIASAAQAIYRSLQVGVVLLTAGTILGGIWADYSWGRFWGWDPKETWAFIALMGYLVILHGRIMGWLRNFGLAAGSILAFSLVIMAWYGVNFVLGAGLHTYGFGAGGVEYVSAFVAVHLLYVAFVSTVRHGRLKSKKS